MKIMNAFPSKYLSAGDLDNKPHTMTMACVEMEVIGGDDKKPVLYFTRGQKGLVLNKTNSKQIASAYGDDTDEWEGKPIVLFPAMVDFKGDTVEAIRVRMPKPAATVARPGGAKPVKQPEPEHDEHDELNPPAGDDINDLPW
jgi:hypothetical protein